MKPIGSYYLERSPANRIESARETLYQVVGHQPAHNEHGMVNVFDAVAWIDLGDERVTERGYWLHPSEVQRFLSSPRVQRYG